MRAVALRLYLSVRADIDGAVYAGHIYSVRAVPGGGDMRIGSQRNITGRVIGAQAAVIFLLARGYMDSVRLVACGGNYRIVS